MDLTAVVDVLAKIFEFIGLDLDAAAIVEQIVAWFESIIAMLG